MSFFDERASDWDSAERIRRASVIADAIREHVPLTPDLRAIDVGSGTGLLGLELLPSVGSIVLADPSEGMVSVARAKIAAGGIEHASAVIYDVNDDPPAGAPFDLVVSLLVLHHVPDTDAALRSIRSMLVPGGRIALVDLDAEDGSFHDDPESEGIVHHGFDREELGARATAAGFDDVATRIISKITKDDDRDYPLFLLTGRRIP